PFTRHLRAARFGTCPIVPRTRLKEIGLIRDALVTQELGPRSHGSVREILRWTVASRVPSPGGFARRFPQEGKATVTMAIQDQPVIAPESVAASSRTLRGVRRI